LPWVSSSHDCFFFGLSPLCPPTTMLIQLCDLQRCLLATTQ
jgi:hypothetical protein